MSLRDQLKNAQSRMHEIHDEIEGVGEVAEKESRDISESEIKLIDGLRAEFEGLEKTAATLTKAADAADRVTTNRIASNAITNPPAPPISAGGLTIPAAVARQRSTVFENTADCYAMGRWLFGMMGDQDSKKWSISNGFEYRSEQSVGTPGSGGYTVPTPLAAEIIRLVEEYGIFRQFSRNIPMTAMTLDVPESHRWPHGEISRGRQRD